MSQKLFIPVSSGLKLAGIYHEPTTPGAHPLVILLHGFTGYKEEGHIVTLAGALTRAGIAALRIDAPGSGESGGTWADDFRLSNYVKVVPDVVDFAKTHLSIDPSRLGIWGHSMGGFVALKSAADQPDTFKMVCGSQPSNGWKLLPAAEAEDWLTSGWASFSNDHFSDIMLPYAFYEDRQNFDVLREVVRLTIPSLFIAGTNDKLVPAALVKAMYAAAPEPKKYLEFPTGHGYKRDSENLARINSATVTFFRQLTVK